MDKTNKDETSSVFCILCSGSLEENTSATNFPDDKQEDSLVLVNQSTSEDGLQLQSNDGDTVIIRANSETLTDLQWMNKYQSYLSKVLCINLDEGVVDDEGAPKTKSEDVNKKEDTLVFCSKCKKGIEDLYNIEKNSKFLKDSFKDKREEIAIQFSKSFVKQKFLSEEKLEEDMDLDEIVTAGATTLVDKWRPIYTGEADKLLKEKQLVNEIREELLSKNEFRVKTEFPEGTGLSAMELAKIQRMMTACYFTPKMSMVRKRGKLFFGVGVPRTDKDNVYECPVCQEICQHLRSLNVHMLRHKSRTSKNLINCCNVCGETFNERRDLILHKKDKHPGVETGRPRYQRVQEFYSCGICGLKFTSKAGRTNHLKKSHPNTSLFICQNCQEVFISEDSLALHERVTHNKTSVTIVNNGETDEIHATGSSLFHCQQCAKCYLTQTSLEDHIKVHTDGNLSGCYYCGFGFTSLKALEEHTAVVHISPNPFNCEGCEHKFNTEELLLAHLKTVHDQLAPCETCGKVFESIDVLTEHIKTHISSSGVTPKSNHVQICSLCNIVFTDSKSFDDHLLTKHGGKFPFKCTICGDEDEGFKDAKELRKHRLEVHPDSIQDLEHLCTQCFASYSTQEELQNHTSKTHEKFKCDVCNRVFKLADHLRRHAFIHTGEKPFTCTVCDKSFNQESNLKEHLYRHSGVKPHRCLHCSDVAYLRRIQLKEHMQKEHGVEDVPTLPIGRAAQNAKKAGTFSHLLSTNSTSPSSVQIIKAEPRATNVTISSAASATKIIQSDIQPYPILTFPVQQPPTVKDVTIANDRVDRIAPLIMQSLQNKSNQSVIVRRGIQVPEKNNKSSVGAVHIKSDGITSDGQIIEAMEINEPSSSSTSVTSQKQPLIVYKM